MAQSSMNNTSLTYNELEETNNYEDLEYALIISTIINVFTFLIGLVGNIITCIVIACNRSMRTTTNYYLFNLAISDLLLLITGVPYEIILNWYPDAISFGFTTCFLRNWSAEMSSDVSVLTITVFTVERYLAVCHPFVAQAMSRMSRVIKLIIAVWIIGGFCAAIIALQVHVIDGKNICLFTGNGFPHSLELMSLIFFIIPMTVITILYILIGVTLLKSRRMERNRGIRDVDEERRSASTKKVLKILVTVVVAFFICWAPFHVQRLMGVYSREIIGDNLTSTKQILFSTIYFISGIFYFFSAAINPIIYSIMSNKFRNAFKETLSNYCKMPFLLTREPSTSTNAKTDYTYVKADTAL